MVTLKHPLKTWCSNHFHGCWVVCNLSNARDVAWIVPIHCTELCVLIFLYFIGLCFCCPWPYSAKLQFSCCSCSIDNYLLCAVQHRCLDVLVVFQMDCVHILCIISCAKITGSCRTSTWINVNDYDDDNKEWHKDKHWENALEMAFAARCALKGDRVTAKQTIL